MKWESWDPDLKCLEKAPNSPIDGSTFTFVMKTGKRIKATLEATENERLGYLASFWGSSGKLECEILLVEKERGMTEIQYSFGLLGCVGSLWRSVISKTITIGVEKGLANIIKISEDAQKAISN